MSPVTLTAETEACGIEHNSYSRPMALSQSVGQATGIMSVSTEQPSINPAPESADGGSIPASPIQVKEVNLKTAKPFVETHHYSKKFPAGKNICFGWYDGEELFAVAVYGIGVNAVSDTYLRKKTRLPITKDNLYELKRLCRSGVARGEHLPGEIDRDNARPLTKFLANCHKILRARGILFIVTFSDPEHTPVGGIYRAANFIRLGETDAERHFVGPNSEFVHRRIPYRQMQRVNIAAAKELDPEQFEALAAAEAKSAEREVTHEMHARAAKKISGDRRCFFEDAVKQLHLTPRLTRPKTRWFLPLLPEHRKKLETIQRGKRSMSLATTALAFIEETQIILDEPVGVQLSKTGLAFNREVSFSEWIDLGSKLKMAEGTIQWWIGDWLNYGEKAYGDKYTEALQTLDYEEKSLRNMASISKKVEMSRRRDNLSWSHHAEVAVLEPEQQAEMLTRAQAELLSVRELRAAVKQTDQSQSVAEAEHIAREQKRLEGLFKIPVTVRHVGGGDRKSFFTVQFKFEDANEVEQFADQLGVLSKAGSKYQSRPCNATALSARNTNKGKRITPSGRLRRGPTMRERKLASLRGAS